jgi:hypothetical protein
MEANQFKRREFNELDAIWYNPMTWFGQPSIPPPNFNQPTQEFKNVGYDPFKKNTESTLSSALKSNFISPFKKVETTVVSDVKNVEKSVVNIAETAENDLKYIGTEIYDGAKWVVKESEIIGNDVANAGRGLYKFGSKTVQFIENYYPFILFAGGSYLGARYINELKQAVA